MQSPDLRPHLERAVAKERILDKPIERIAHASDASFYRLVPRAVVLPESVDEVAALFRVSHELRVPLTFRAAGTSLSGQAVTDGILVDVSRHFRGIDVLEGGRRVRVQPGVIGAHVNRALKPYGRKMGPDPASIATCQMGGILSNNASGMCCGVEQNAFHTLRSIRFLLPSGTLIDTDAPDADAQLLAKEPELYKGLLGLRVGLLADDVLASRVREKYKRKNTTGYSLNALLDYGRPVDMLAHALIGAEGTLAFIADAALDTVPDLPVKHTGLLFFDTIHAACAAIVPLRDAGAKALEVMDRASLRSVQDKPGMPALLKTLPPDAAALLVEFQAEREQERPALAAAARAAAGTLRLLAPAVFTDDPAEQAKLWLIRAGMFPSVGAVRARGTTVIIEDVAFPLEHLADAAVDLTKLFRKHGYEEGIIFGHAKDGNLHFVITQGFGDRAEIDRYARFIDELVEVVVKKYDGALKAEHGTGRNMAPFVETEWGPGALAIMRRLKELCDPTGLLNPGVIVPDGPRAHLENLKGLPAADDEIDKCIECGFCEPRCPSRELTVTPRQRIVLRRELARRPEAAAEFGNDLQYMLVDTCAADGMCATACPVGIDTGLLVKRLRHEEHSWFGERTAAAVASSMRATQAIARLGLRVLRIAPAASGRSPRTAPAEAKAIYFPSCLSRTIDGAEVPLQDALVEVARRAGMPLHIPPRASKHCCGVPFSSKGYEAGHCIAVNATIPWLYEESRGGELPIVMDTSPCTYGLVHCEAALTPANLAKHAKLRIHDVVGFASELLLPRLTITNKAKSVVLHPVCSVVKMGLAPSLEAVARACSETVLVPPDAGCCGFAGDRGFSHPELTASATRAEASQVQGDHDGCYSSSRTCEIGMERATGRAYRSIVYLLEQATR